MRKAYTTYITEHCKYVSEAYRWLVDHKIVKNDFVHRMQLHDTSKWSEEEYDAYDAYYGYENRCYRSNRCCAARHTYLVRQARRP